MSRPTPTETATPVIAEAVRREYYGGCVSTHDARWPRRVAESAVAALAAAGYVIVQLPEPDWRKEATEDENGAVSWEYPDGEVVVYEDGFFELRALGINHTDADRLRQDAAALLAAAVAAERVVVGDTGDHK